jgi:hypothetical protein
VRANSFSPKPKVTGDHHLWFQAGLANPSRLLLIATAADGCPIGQIRFDRQPASTEGSVSGATVDLSLDRCARGPWTRFRAGEAGGLLAMEQRWGLATDAAVEALTSNTASNA